MWGGWSCAGCGAELSSSRQVIGGRVDAPDGIRVALRPPHQQRSRSLTMLGGFGAPLLGVVGPVVAALLGQWLLIPTLAVMVVMLLMGLVGVSGLLGKHEVLLNASAIRWGDVSIRPDAITAVRQEGDAVLLLTEDGAHRLVPLGGPAALLEATEEVRRIARVTGTAEDIPDPLRHIQRDRLHR
ncbi:MAG: hypothetical protein ACI8S6_004509 [Myxococcota bacterium]|jgi:hypothetical protein